VDLARVEQIKLPLVQQAARTLLASPSHPWKPRLDRFRSEEPGLQNMATFRVLQRSLGGSSWWEWPEQLKWRDERALAQFRDEFSEDIAVEEISAFFFDMQWSALKGRATEAGIALIGDLPIYVAANSADVWEAPQLFDLSSHGEPAQVAGVPPDEFSPLGQCWENPLYDWSAHAADGFSWWCDRVAKARREFDLIRLDHFRGFVGYFAIDSSTMDPREGVWLDGPGRALFDALEEALGAVAFLAEDLGVITDDVDTLRESLGLPSMKVLQFGLDGEQENPHAPQNIGADSVVYTGTHDNATSQGWWDEADQNTRGQALETVGGPESDFVDSLIELALQSPAEWAFVPVQDFLGLGNEARMNVPGTVTGNWNWRLDTGQLDTSLKSRLRARVEASGRL
jgi:4-alpha-glucanotransferase